MYYHHLVKVSGGVWGFRFSRFSISGIQHGLLWAIHFHCLSSDRNLQLRGAIPMLDGLASPRGRLLRRGGLSEARPSRVLGRHGFHRQLKLPSSLKDDSRQVANATSGEEAQVQPMLRLATSRRACMTALTASAATWTLGGGGGGAASGATTTTTISVGQLVECVELPLTWDGSSYLVNFWLQPSRDEPFEPFTAALDTGSPFLTVLREGQRNCEAFGCFSGEGVNSGLESTYEQYGLQRDEVTDWLLGAVVSLLLNHSVAYNQPCTNNVTP